MTNFRTIFSIDELPSKINYKSNILSFGSCFSENIGDKLTVSKFNALVNPFGILYNPESIANSFEILLKNKTFTVDDLFNHQGVWNSFYHHSRFSNTDKDICLTNINNAINEANNQLNNADFILITFGTAWVYEHKRNGKIVSNCHKVPAKEFVRYRLAACDIVEKYKSIIKKIKTENINCRFIFTVSPVRHLKDGAIENQLSKATLLTAVNELVESIDKCYYFPSYELMMDDLRDYRFYADDMLHPSETAINYIWEKFVSKCIDSDSQQTMQNIKKLLSAVNHRPLQPGSESHKKFVVDTIKKIEIINTEFPEMNFSKEIFTLKKQLDH